MKTNARRIQTKGDKRKRENNQGDKNKMEIKKEGDKKKRETKRRWKQI